MTISIEEARKIMGVSSKEYTDLQIETMLNIFMVISDLVIDTYMAKNVGKEVTI